MLAQQAPQRWHSQPSLVQQLAAGLDCLKACCNPLPEPFGDCILLLSVATAGEPAATFYVRRPTLEAAWRAGTTQVRQWAWSRSLDCVELRIDWPLHISALQGLPGAASQGHTASAWALADESLETVHLLPPQAWPARSSAAAAKWLSPTQRDALPRAHWLLHLQGLYVGSEGGLVRLPRLARLPRPPGSATDLHPTPSASVPPPDAGLLVLQALALPEPTQDAWSSDRLEAFCARLYALVLMQQHYQQASASAAMQKGVAQLLGRAALQLCRQIQQPLPLPSAPFPHALCLLVLARYAQALPVEPADAMGPLMARLAEHLAPGQSRSSPADLQPPLPRSGATALAPAWRWVALAAYANWLATGTHATTVHAPALAAADLTALEAMARHWLQWHLLAHGGAAAPVPDWSVIAVAELALQPQLLPARQHLQGCSWLAALRQPLLSHLPQSIHPEAAMFLPPDTRENTAFIETFTAGDKQQTSSWRIYQWIHHISVPQLMNF